MIQIDSFCFAMRFAEPCSPKTLHRSFSTLHTRLKVTLLGLLRANSKQRKWKGHFGRRESKMNNKLWIGFNLSGVTAITTSDTNIFPNVGCWAWLVNIGIKMQPHKRVDTHTCTTHTHTHTHLATVKANHRYDRFTPPSFMNSLTHPSILSLIKEKQTGISSNTDGRTPCHRPQKSMRLRCTQTDRKTDRQTIRQTDGDMSHSLQCCSLVYACNTLKPFSLSPAWHKVKNKEDWYLFPISYIRKLILG